MKTLWMWMSIGILLIPISALGITWDFETDGDTEGWTRSAPMWSEVGGSYENMEVSDGVLYVDVSEGYYGVGVTSPELNLDTALFDKLKVRVRISSGTVVGSFKMWWLATTSSLHEERIQGVVVHKPHVWTGEWQEIETSAFLEEGNKWEGGIIKEGEWRGKIVRFGLGFVFRDKSVGEQEVPDRVEIDWISLTGDLEELLGEDIELPGEVFTPGELFGEAVRGSGVIAPYSGYQIWGGDFDLDGDVDLMVRGTAASYLELSPKLFVLLNKGEGVFSKNWEYAYNEKYPLWPVGGGDVDGDGDMDVVMCHYEEGMISLFLNRGDGTFAQGESCSVGPHPAGGWVGDLDGDGDLDIVIASSYLDVEHLAPEEGTISILFNRGDGTFSPSVDYAAGEHPAKVWGGDLDGDEDPDIVVVSVGDFGAGVDPWNSPPDYVYVWFNDGVGGLYDRRAYRVGNHPYHMWGDDIDGDGDIDLVVMNCADERTLTVLLNRGDGIFEEGESYRELAKQPAGLWGGDFDLDGDVDLAISDRWARLVVLSNRGDGTFVQEGEYRTPILQSNLFGADLDGDGDVDLAVGSDANSGFFVLFNRSKGGVTSVLEEGIAGGAGEQGWMLYTPNPNPFNATTLVPFDLAFPWRVNLTLYDVLGKKVRTLVEGVMPPGHHTILWDGRDDEGHPVASGRYLVRLQAGTFSDSKTITLIK